MVFQNFELYNPTVTLELIVWSLVIGLSIGAAASFVNRRIVGDFVRRLLKDGVHTPDAAVTLSAAGFARNIFVRMALREGKPLRRLVSLANPEDMAVRHPSDARAMRALRKFFSVEAEDSLQLDFASARFYIPEEMRITAELRYEAKGTTVLNLILSILLLIAAGLAALYVVPELLAMVDGFLSMIG